MRFSLWEALKHCPSQSKSENHPPSSPQNCPGYQFDIAVAYDVDSGDLYYAIGDFGGEKTSVPAGNIFWKYLGVYSKS